MSDPTESEQGAALPLDLQPLLTRQVHIPTTEYIRPCERIEPETKEFAGVTTIAERYDALTQLLPLAGASALKPRRDGTLAITAHLRTQAPWLSPAIDLIDEQLQVQVWTGRPWIGFRPMLLVGPPGCGKSHLARLIAEQAETGHVILSLAAVADATTLEGTPRGFTATMPCFPALAMSQTGTANPIAVCDEIDKADHNPRHGDPLAALLTLIEKSTARHYWDRCLLAQIDVSNVNWIFTANDLSRLSSPLRSRLDIVNVQGPGAEHFEAVATNLQRDIAKTWGVPPSMLPCLEPEAEQVLRQRFRKHRSVRQLHRELQAALGSSLSTQPRLLS